MIMRKSVFLIIAYIMLYNISAQDSLDINEILEKFKKEFNFENIDRPYDKIIYENGFDFNFIRPIKAKNQNPPYVPSIPGCFNSSSI